MWSLYVLHLFGPHLAWQSLTNPTGKRESSAKFESTPFKPYTPENAEFGPLLVIECRGLEFVGFDPRVRFDLHLTFGLHVTLIYFSIYRVYGNVKEQEQKKRSFLRSIWSRANGMITMRRCVLHVTVILMLRDSYLSQQAAVPVGISEFQSRWDRAQ